MSPNDCEIWWLEYSCFVAKELHTCCWTKLIDFISLFSYLKGVIFLDFIQ